MFRMYGYTALALAASLNLLAAAGMRCQAATSGVRMPCSLRAAQVCVIEQRMRRLVSVLIVETAVRCLAAAWGGAAALLPQASGPVLCNREKFACFNSCTQKQHALPSGHARH